MPYTPLQLPDSIDAPVRAFVADKVDPIFHDVREMLRHRPQPSDPAFNLSLALLLCSAIGGLSRVFLNECTGDGKAFRAAARRYPLRDEPKGCVRDPKVFARTLYGEYRCNLVHSFGLNMAQRGDGRWVVERSSSRLVVVRRPEFSVTDAMLSEIEAPEGRPDGLPPTMSKVGDKMRLSVDALYWGVRRLTREFVVDSVTRATACNVLTPWYRESRYTSGGGSEVTSSANMQIDIRAFGDADRFDTE